MGEQIGTVGDECAANNHLHFAIYTKDEVGTFISHDAEIIPNSVEVNFGQSIDRLDGLKIQRILWYILKFPCI